MFSAVLGFFQRIYKRKAKKEERKSKKEIRNEKRKLLGQELSIEKKKDNKKATDSVITADEKAKKSAVVQESLAKKAKYWVKAKVLWVLKCIVSILESFFLFIISFLGIHGLLIVAAGVVISIAIFGIIKMDTFVSSDESTITGTTYDDCIQGGQAISSTGYDLDAIASLLGTLTDYEKNLYRTLSLYNEILSDTSGIASPNNINTIISKIGKDNTAKFLFGFSATETGMQFTNDNKDIFQYPSKLQKNSAGYAFLGLHYDNYFDGTYRYNGRSKGAGTRFLTEDFVTKWKSKYVPSETPIYDNNFVPYGVATQVGAYAGSYLGSHFSNVSTNFPAIMDKYGIQANREKLVAFAQLFAGAGYYHTDNGSVNTNLFSLWCALWSATSTTDSQRSFDNIKIVFDSSYAEGSARKYIVGSGGGNSNTVYITGQNMPGYFEINGKAVSSTLWEYAALNCSNKEYFEQTAQVWLDEYSGSTLILNGHYGLLAYLMGNKIVEDLGGSMPLVIGGSASDCVDNSGYIDVQVGEYKNTVGQPQGVWNINGVQKTTLDLINEMEVGKAWGNVPASSMTNGFITRVKNFVPYMGDAEHAEGGNPSCYYIEQAKKVLTETKFKAPYYHQGYGGTERWKSLKSGTYYESTSNDVFNSTGCHTYSFAYALSVLQGRLINPPESLVIGWYAGLWNGGMGGDTYVEHLAPNLGINAFTMPDGKNDGKAKLNEVLDKNGIVIAYLSKPFSSGDFHWICITEHIIEGGEDKYKIWTSTQISQIFQTYTYDYLYDRRVGDNWLRIGFLP